MSGVSKAEFSPMENFAQTLESNTKAFTSIATSSAPPQTGSPPMDAALADLANWLQLCAQALSEASSGTSAAVRRAMEKFVEADS